MKITISQVKVPLPPNLEANAPSVHISLPPDIASRTHPYIAAVRIDPHSRKPSRIAIDLESMPEAHCFLFDADHVEGEYLGPTSKPKVRQFVQIADLVSSNPKNWEAVHRLGLAYLQGEGVAQDKIKGRVLLSEAASDTPPDEAALLVKNFWTGQMSRIRSEEEALIYVYMHLQQKNEPMKTVIVDHFRIVTNLSASPEVAKEYFILLFDQGESAASFYIATKLLEGDEMHYNPKRAFDYMQEAAAESHLDAISKLAEMHEEGLGTPQNNQLANICYWRAAHHDKAGAEELFRYARFLEKTSSDGERARFYLEAAEGEGHPEATARMAAIRTQEEWSRKRSILRTLR